MSNVAIIAALERELYPLVAGWTSAPLTFNGGTFSCYQSGELVAVAGGIGCRQAELAARAVMEKYRPRVLVSAGLAGALIRSLKVGNIFMPNVIVDAATGAEYRCQGSGDATGGGVLVSVSEVAGSESKTDLAERFHALVVDMEAAGVARVAEEYKAGFRCVKAISDEFDFIMPPMNRFVDGEGYFQTAKFAAWTVVHPQWWRSVVRLARNSSRATRALCDWLGKNLNSSLPPATVVTLRGAGYPKN